MAHIPYGYRIERGKAVVLPDQVHQIKTFLQSYINGSSITAAGSAAGIPLSRTALSKILENEVYLGTSYYPAVLDRTFFEEVQAVRRSRTRTGHKRPRPICPVRTHFQIRLPEDVPDPGISAAESAAILYEMILPSETGRSKMSESDKALVEKWCRMNHLNI